MSQTVSYDNLDLEDESDQKVAIRDYLKLSGYNDEQINKKIEIRWNLYFCCKHLTAGISTGAHSNVSNSSMGSHLESWCSNNVKFPVCNFER